MVWGTMNPSPSMDRQYRDFNTVFVYKAGTYATRTRYLRGRYLGTRYRVHGGKLSGTGTYVRYLIHQYFTI